MRARETRAEPERRKIELETAMGSLIWRFSAFHARKLLLLTAQARFRRRSTHVPNLTEFGSTLERHWRDI